ncbi:MAG: dihydroorotase [Oliverpabstia sp.]|nr:dihydroorotase [Lachnospiraceae bacterium]MDY5027156.1 dihydroorotase [Oliverpabstia sp.]
MKILIKNGRIIDPDSKMDQVAELLIENDKIAAVEEKIEEEADRVVDAEGCYVMPGLIDMHVHLRDPGLTHKEDIITGARAAARGGVTTVLAMPNTKPVMDDPSRVAYVKNKAKDYAKVNVLQVGAITKGMKGEELSDIEGMVKAGIPAISEDGKSVMNAQLYKEAMLIAKRMNIPVLAHCEDIHMVNGGCMNEDENSRKFGLPGISNAVEDTIVARDIIISRDTGCHLHLCHCSTEASMILLKLAKERGIPVTGEVCPHHFTLTSDDMVKDDTNYKMNPPLRTPKDVEALKKGLKEDVFDVISTDHAPHSSDEKNQSMQKAPFGIVGLETSVALTITELVDKGWLTPMQMAEKMSYNPARILHLDDKGSLKKGKTADVVIIDPEEEYTIDVKQFVSKGKNSPFNGKKVKGKVKMTICSGTVVYEDR